MKLGSVVADDSNGRKSSDQQHRTAVYSAIHEESGDLLVGVADTAIMHQLDDLYVDVLADHLTSISAIKLLVLDGNLSTDAFTSLVSTASRRGVSLFFEPTSVSYRCWPGASIKYSTYSATYHDPNHRIVAMSHGSLHHLCF